MSMATRIASSGIALALALVAAQAQSPATQGTPAPGAGAPAATTAAPASGAEQGPSEVVQAAAQGMLQALDKDRAAFRRDPSKVSELVNTYLLPHWDTEYSARLVLGQYWRTATPRAAPAFHRRLLSLAARQLRRGALGVHRRPAEDLSDYRRPRQVDRDGAH